VPWRGDGSTAEKTAALATALKGHVGAEEPAVIAMARAIVGYRVAVIGCLLMDGGRRSKHDAWDEVAKHCSAAIEVLHAVVGEELTSRYGDGFSEDDVDALMHAGQHEMFFGTPQDALTDALCDLSVALIDLLTPLTNDPQVIGEQRGAATIAVSAANLLWSQTSGGDMGGP